MLKSVALATAVAVLVTCMTATTALAKGGGKAGKIAIALVQKDPVTWAPVHGGASGEFKFELAKRQLKCKFKADLLQPKTNYALIYFPDPWPGHGLICLAAGVSDEGGFLKLKGRAEIDGLPIPSDANYPCGAKIWLVLSDDVDFDNHVMKAWHPESYLFQEALVNFSRDVEVEGPAN